MEQKRKQKLFRVLNIIAFAIVIVLVFHYRERFYAMMHPKGKELIQNIAPELAEGKWVNSEPLMLSGLKGKVIVLDFWTFDCINCQHVLPSLSTWFERYHDKGVVIIGVHTPETTEEEDFSSLQSFVKQWKISFPVVTDNSYQTWNRYNVQFWPSVVLIDKEGLIREFHIGELGYSALEKRLQELLNE